MKRTFVILAATVLASSAVNARAGVIAHWSFDEASGSAADSQGTYTGELGAKANQNAEGKFPSVALPNGISFNGAYTSSSYMNVTTSMNSMLAGSFTIAGWIKPTDLITHPYPTIFDQIAGNSLRLRVSGSQLDFYLLSDVGTHLPLVNAKFGSIQADQWQHVAIVWDRQDENRGVASYYVNGQFVNSQNSAGYGATSAAPYVVASPVYTFGRDGSDNSLYSFKGNMDEFWVFNEALGGSQIATLASTNLVPEPATAAIAVGLLLCALARFVRAR